MYIIITKKQALLLLYLITILLLLVIAHIALRSVEASLHNNMPAVQAFQGDWDKHFEHFEPAQTGYSVYIDLDEKTLYLYEDSTMIKTWPVSGGSKASPSPTGAWVVTGIGNWGAGFGGSWIALNVPWGKYGIHGTTEPWAVGSSNVSHGCIRMKDADVAELKKYMSEGVPVYIKQDSAPFRALKDGKIGSDVLKLQIILKNLGYYEAEPDGKFGKKTFEAVCRFQKAEQIKVDGIVGRQSWDILQKHNAEYRWI